METNTTAGENNGAGTPQGSSKSSSPIVIDLGSAKRSQIRLLQKGAGPLTETVFSVLDELRSDGTIGESAQPVIVVVKQKITRMSLLSNLL